MEDILDLYAAPPDPKRPVVCFDELPVGLIGDVQAPLPAAPGRVRKQDYEYTRHGSANVLLAFDRHRCWRWAKVTPQRRGAEFADFMHHLLYVEYPDAEVIRLVCDNLNTHSPASFYHAFDPETAVR